MPHTTTRVVNELLQRHRSCDAAIRKAAQDDLISVAQRRLLWMVRRRFGSALRGHADSGDVVQATSINLQRALEAESVQPQHAGEFFRLAARHVQFELCKIAKKMKRTPIAASGGVEPFARAADSPVANVENADRVLAISSAVDELPDELRDVIRLTYYLDLPRSEVAAALGVSEATVGRLHVKAKRVLGVRLRRLSVASEE